MKRILLLGILAMTAVSFSACRPWWHKTMQERAGYIAKKIGSKLDLNDSQQQKLNAMRDEVVKKLEANEKEMVQLSRDFEGLVRADKMDPKKLKELKDRRTAVQTDVETVMMDKLVEFHGILTAEQRTKAADLLKKFRERRFGEKAALLDFDFDDDHGIAVR